jgi:hypothetical protein
MNLAVLLGPAFGQPILGLAYEVERAIADARIVWTDAPAHVHPVAARVALAGRTDLARRIDSAKHRGRTPLCAAEYEALERRLVERRADLAAITAPRWRVALASRAVRSIDTLRSASRW